MSAGPWLRLCGLGASAAGVLAVVSGELGIAHRVLVVVASKVESSAFARFLAEPSEKAGLGCSDALNLDGGPSTQLVVRLPALTLSLPGWGVPNALVAIPAKR